MKMSPCKIISQLLLLLCAATSLHAQTVYERVKLRNPLPTPNHLTGMEVINDRFIAFGEYGTLLSSSDGENWTLHNTGYEKEIQGIAYGNGTYVATGADNRYILTSPDLETWTLERPANVPFNPSGILFRAGKFWTCGSSSMVSNSVDGKTWEQQELDEDFRRFTDITYADGLYVITARDYFIATSPDGINWTERPTGIEEDGLPGSLLSVQYRNGRFVVGGAQGTLLSSSNGVNWTEHTTPTESWVFDVEFYDGSYYTTGRGGDVFRSTDLNNWELIEVGQTDTLYGIERKGGVSVVVGRQGGIFRSTNLSDWDDQREQGFESVNRARFIGGKFVLSTFSDTLYESSDTLTWEVFRTSDINIQDYIFADGKWVTVGFRGEISQSLDGVLWGASVPQFDDNPRVNGIRYLNGRWFLIGSSGLIRSSNNLSDWTISDPDDSTRFNDLIFANGTFVAVGDDGKIFTSSNGTNFVSRESGTDRDFRAVSFGNNAFVAGGAFFQPFVSSDGITWSNDGVSGAPSFNDVEFQDGLFVGSGFTGSVGYSQDGKDWTTIRLGVSNSLSSISSGNDRVLITGSGGLLMSSDPLPQRTLTLNTSGSGTVTSDPAGASYLDGTLVTLTASPGDGSAFSGWSGDLDGNENPVTLAMDANKTITANFVVALVGYDLWRASEFNAAERSNDLISGKFADPDQDGRNNLYEYYLVSSPKSPDSPQMLSFKTVDLGGGDYPVVTYRRRKDAADVTERVEISNDLMTWRHNGNSNDDQTFVFSLDDNGDGTETISYRTKSTLNANRATFFRIVIE